MRIGGRKAFPLKRPGRHLLILAALLTGACSPQDGSAPRDASPSTERLPLLLVTLDTTRADAVAPEAPAEATPHLAALAERGLRFSQAYATAPMTLPSHASMLTGLLPADHRVQENGRTLDPGHPLLAERLHAAGYRTAAFVSGFPLDRRFGLARGFERYDDELAAGGAGAAGTERNAAATTDRALAWLAALPAGDTSRNASAAPPFLWVHYYDPHEPYAPPEPFRSRFTASPYHGEVAFVDQQAGRLLAAFADRYGADGFRVAVVGDHGEGLGDHGERYHGNLLYNSVMRVPLLLAGPGVSAGVRGDPVSVRQIFDTFLGWAGDEAPGTLLAPGSADDVVIGEALAPFFQYGWVPQVMVVHGRLKMILSGGRSPMLVFDVVNDPAETQPYAPERTLTREMRLAWQDYAARMVPPAPAPDLDEETRRRLASLGYVTASSGGSRVREDAPNAPQMVHLFDDLDLASGLFEAGEYERVLPVLERILEADPRNHSAVLRLAVAHSVLGDGERAEIAFRRAGRLVPGSPDVAHYRGMHHLREGEWDEAAVFFETVLATQPRRLPALEGLARAREGQNRPAEAAVLLLRVAAAKPEPVPELLRAGELAMAAGDTPTAVAAYEQARDLQGAAFRHHLELGVLYLAQRRLPEAAESLDRVPPDHPGYPMALFKRAQIAALTGAPDRDERIRRAWQRADEVTRPLIRQERLFAGTDLP